MSRPPMTGLMLLTAGTLLVLSAFRWHEAAAASPDRIRSADGAVAVLVVQAGDCPLRRAAMMAWLSALRDTVSPPGDGSVSLAVLREGTDAPDDRLASLPRLDASDTRTAARVLLRSGVPGTPAVVFLDPGGNVLLADTFSPDGLGPRILAAAEVLGAVAGASDLPPSAPSRER